MKKKLERDGFLGSALSSTFGGNLCLFGDNAYVQTPYMCTPWKAVSGGSKDAFNFYHSQLRINIECAFGMLVHRWGMLRKPIPMNITVSKTSRLVLALCKLHNFCIDNRDTQVERPQFADASNIVLEGGFALPRMDGQGEIWEYEMSESNPDRVSHLLDGGCHRDDHTRAARRRFRRDKSLPCQSILREVKSMGVRRPPRSTFRR